MSSPSRQRRPLPVIDLVQLLGPDFRLRFTPARDTNQSAVAPPNQQQGQQQQQQEEPNVAKMPQKERGKALNNSTQKNVRPMKHGAPQHGVTKSEALKHTGHPNPSKTLDAKRTSLSSGRGKRSFPGEETHQAKNDNIHKENVNEAAVSSHAKRNRPVSNGKFGPASSCSSKRLKRPASRKPKSVARLQVATTTSAEIAPLSLNRCVPLVVIPSQVSR